MTGLAGNARGEGAAPTVREARRRLAQSFLRAGSPSPGLDARLLVEGSLGADNADPDTLLPAERARLAAELASDGGPVIHRRRC